MRLVLRLATAAFVALNGSIHLRLWQDGYRYIDDVGVLFLLGTVIAAVLAAAVLVRPAPAVLAAVVAFSAGSLGALLLSRTGGGLLGFVETGWSPDARRALVAEAGATVTAGALLLLGGSLRPGSASP
jgi:hypothetical protein